MCVSVGLSVKYVVVWSISLLGLCLLGSSVCAGALGFVGTRNMTFCFSAPLRVCLSSRYLRPRFWNVPGAGAFGGFDSPAGLWLRLLLLLARDVQSAVPSLRSSVVLRAVPPPLGVCCGALFSVFVVGVGRFSGVNKSGRLFGGASPSGFVFGLRLQASPSGFAFELRLRASPSGFAFGLRLRASPSGPPEATARLMAHGRCLGSFPDPDSPQTPTAHRGRICRGTPPYGILERFLPHLLCFTLHLGWCSASCLATKTHHR